MENCSPFSVAFNSEASNAGSPELVLKLAVPENWPVLLGRHVTIRSMDCWGSTDTQPFRNADRSADSRMMARRSSASLTKRCPIQLQSNAAAPATCGVAMEVPLNEA